MDAVNAFNMEVKFNVTVLLQSKEQSPKANAN